MKSLTLVTGGARSGKSTFAENLINKEQNVVYIATAIPFDKEMKDRIKKHRDSRPSNWYTIERYKEFEEVMSIDILSNAEYVLVDCITLMITNLLLENSNDFDNTSMEEIDEIEKNIFKEIDKLLNVVANKKVIIVTNEIGMGIVPDNLLSRVFRDIAGRVNQYIAKKADYVYLLVSGIPVTIKGIDNE